MEKKKLKKTAITLLKLTISAAGVYIVFLKIDLVEILLLVKNSNWALLFASVVLFNASKILSSLRLNQYFQALDIKMNEIENLKLYYIGMFYNLFLPGGIGGDAYKVFLLNKKFGAPLKKISAAVLLDRISGMVALTFLAMILALTLFDIKVKIILMFGILFTFPIFKIASFRYFPSFQRVFTPTTFQALGVQILQIIQVLVLIAALGHTQKDAIPYLFAFLISSAVTVLPISIGGVGVRELTFLILSTYLEMDITTAISISTLFFITTAISSLPGAILKS